MRIDPVPPLVAFAVSLVVTGLVTAWARRRGAVEAPDPSRRIHTVPTPRLGGVGIAAGIASGIALHLATGRARALVELLALSSGGALFFAVGLADDLKRMPPWAKWLLQVLAAAAAVLAFRMRFQGAPSAPWPGFDLGDLSTPLTILWVLAVVNVINFLDGIDGIVVATVAVALAAGCASRSLDPAPLSLPLAAALGFAVWNAPRARVFMGDGGSHLLGFAVAVSVCGVPELSIRFGREVPPPRFTPTSPWPIVGAALLPAILDVAEALIHKARNGIPLSQAHADHLYQRLVKAGWSHGAVALRYGLLSLAGVFLAGPIAEERGLWAAVVLGTALLVIHWATGIRATRGVPRLSKSPS